MLLVKNKSVRLAFGFLETFNLLALRLWLKNRAAAKAFSGRVFRNYMSVAGSDKWRCDSLENVLPGFKGCRASFEYLPGNGIDTYMDELAIFAALTAHVQPKIVFEIGTYRGRATIILALNSPEDAAIHTLDLPFEGRTELDTMNEADAALARASATGCDFAGKDVAKKIKQHFGDSTRFDFSPFYNQVDLVFVDGAHHYDAVASDTRNALKMLRPGGWVMWHDFALYGDYNDVTRAVLDTVPASEVVQIDSSRIALYRKPA